eukprot:gene24704-biopygen19446
MTSHPRRLPYLTAALPHILAGCPTSHPRRLPYLTSSPAALPHILAGCPTSHPRRPGAPLPPSLCSSCCRVSSCCRAAARTGAPQFVLVRRSSCWPAAARAGAPQLVLPRRSTQGGGKKAGRTCPSRQ